MNKKSNQLRFSQAKQGFFLTAQARKLSPHTIADYEVTIKKFQAFLEKDILIENITSDHIQMFLAAQTTISKKTALNYHIGLSAMWTWAVREKIAVEHIVRDVPAPRPEIREIVPYTEGEIKSLLNSLKYSKAYKRPGKKLSNHSLPHAERNRAIILTLLDTGLRAEELCSIKIHQLDRRNQRIHVMGKGSRERYVSISSRTHQAIWRYLTVRPPERMTEGEPLFATDPGYPFKRLRLLKLLHTIGRRAEVPNVTLHRFRHTFAIEYLRNRGDPYTLQRLLGHSDLSMVKRYLAIAQTDIEAAHRLASPVDNWAL